MNPSVPFVSVTLLPNIGQVRAYSFQSLLIQVTASTKNISFLYSYSKGYLTEYWGIWDDSRTYFNSEIAIDSCFIEYMYNKLFKNYLRFLRPFRRTVDCYIMKNIIIVFNHSCIWSYLFSSVKKLMRFNQDKLFYNVENYLFYIFIFYITNIIFLQNIIIH